MNPQRFASLAERLLKAGVSPRRIARLLGLGVAPVRSGVLPFVFEALVLGALWVAPVAAAGAACLLASHRRAPVD